VTTPPPDDSDDSHEIPEPAADPRAEARDPAAGTPRGLNVTQIGAVVLGALVVLALVFGIVQRGRADDLEAERDERREVAAVAGQFAEALFSYSFEDLASSRERVLALVTDELAAEYEEGSFPGLEQIFGELQLTTSAEATDVFVTEVSDTSADAVVGVDLQFSSTATTEAVADVLFLRVALVQEGDAWKVDDAGFLLAPQVGAGGTATTTTVPAG
jgi:hypothetical protein